MKIAVASPAYPSSLSDGLHWVERLTRDAAQEGAEIVCFPESYLPGYPMDEFQREVCGEEQLRDALLNVASVAKANSIAVIIPMDWYVDGQIMNVAHVISGAGELLGHQTKNQLDPTEDSIWQPGTQRSIFQVGELTFGIVICHEGFRYPESVRWAARHGAQVVFHPNLTGSNQQGPTLVEWGSKDNPYYEKAQMVRAMENTIYFATSNYHLVYPESASAIIAPDGSCVAYQQYARPGVVVADIDLGKATGYLASRFRPEVYS